MNIRQLLLAGECVVGSWINSGSPIVAELMATAGFDFLTVDVEHSAVDLPQVQQIFQAIRSGNRKCASLVRVHGVDYALVKRYLDAGADGIIAPLVNTREQAETLIQAVKYPPLGNRGVGFCRANDYGMRLKKSVETADEQTLVVVQIEHIEAVNNIDEILSVTGIDAAFIGPYDLSASMGLTAQFEHPDFLAAQAKILEACGRNGVVAGLHVVAPDPDAWLARYAEGYRLIAYSLDITMLTEACRTGLARLKGGGVIKEQEEPEGGTVGAKS